MSANFQGQRCLLYALRHHCALWATWHCSNIPSRKLSEAHRTKRNRNAEGALTKSAMIQTTLDLHSATAVSLKEKVTKAETLFALSVVSSNLPYTFGDVATATYPHMFPDSEMAKASSVDARSFHTSFLMGLGRISRLKLLKSLTFPTHFTAS